MGDRVHISFTELVTKSGENDLIVLEGIFFGIHLVVFEKTMFGLGYFHNTPPAFLGLKIFGQKIHYLLFITILTLQSITKIPLTDLVAMGTSLRIFLVNEDDTVQRLALAKYDRLLEGHPKERLQRFAGKRIRYALVVVDLVDREPVEILRIQYSYLSFDSEGRIDPAYAEAEARLAFEVLPPLPIERTLSSVIEARHLFAKKRYELQYKWRPTPEIEAALIREIFVKAKNGQ